MVGLLHTMTASGRPLTNTTMSGMTSFLDPNTLCCFGVRCDAEFAGEQGRHES